MLCLLELDLYTEEGLRIRRKDSINQMSVSNLSIVFGPTLLGAPPQEGGLNLEHMSFQCKVSWFANGNQTC
jgi:hypothetical protein